LRYSLSLATESSALGARAKGAVNDAAGEVTDDKRLVQDYLRHKNAAHTVRYARTAAARFEACGSERVASLKDRSKMAVG
jgi:hypothetical protein